MLRKKVLHYLKEGARQLLKQFNNAEYEYSFATVADILIIGRKDMLQAEDEELKPLFLDFKVNEIKSVSNEWYISLTIRINSFENLRMLICARNKETLDQLFEGEAIDYETYAKFFGILANDFSLQSNRLQSVWKDLIPKSFYIGYNAIPIQIIEKIIAACQNHILHFARLFLMPYNQNQSHFQDLLTCTVVSDSVLKHVDVMNLLI
jgi:hypothetical protein